MFLGVVLSFYTFSKKDNNIYRKYSFNEISDSKAFSSAKGAQEYAKLVYKDVVTGEVELSKLAAAKDLVLQKMMIISITLNFVE